MYTKLMLAIVIMLAVLACTVIIGDDTRLDRDSGIILDTD